MAKLFAIMGIGICFIFGLFSLSFAQESITITTYYPSPYGSYNELTTNSMKIGTNYSQAATAFVPNGLLVEGNVGIGTTGPQDKLHLYNGNIRLENTYGVYFYTGGGTGVITNNGMTGNDAVDTLTFRTAAQNRMTISGGNVGIGTTSPATGYRLDVEGKIQATAFDVGDITFRDQKTQKVLWRMFEDEDGLYLENVKTGKIYRFVLQELDK